VFIYFTLKADFINIILPFVNSYIRVARHVVRTEFFQQRRDRKKARQFRRVDTQFVKLDDNI
jgi:hypothetical protein